MGSDFCLRVAWRTWSCIASPRCMPPCTAPASGPAASGPRGRASCGFSCGFDRDPPAAALSDLGFVDVG